MEGEHPTQAEKTRRGSLAGASATPSFPPPVLPKYHPLLFSSFLSCLSLSFLSIILPITHTHTHTHTDILSLTHNHAPTRSHTHILTKTLSLSHTHTCTFTHWRPTPPPLPSPQPKLRSLQELTRGWEAYFDLPWIWVDLLLIYWAFLPFLLAPGLE